MNMADDRVLQRALTDFATSGPGFCLIKLEEYSFPVVGSSFSGTSFLMDYYEDAWGGVVLVSSFIVQLYRTICTVSDICRLQTADYI